MSKEEQKDLKEKETSTILLHLANNTIGETLGLRLRRYLGQVGQPVKVQIVDKQVILEETIVQSPNDEKSGLQSTSKQIQQDKYEVRFSKGKD